MQTKTRDKDGVVVWRGSDLELRTARVIQRVAPDKCRDTLVLVCLTGAAPCQGPCTALGVLIGLAARKARGNAYPGHHTRQNTWDDIYMTLLCCTIAGTSLEVREW